LHTAAIHRDNLPQIRGNLDDPETLALARSFGVPVLINAAVRAGSLREAAAALGIPPLLYEAGEALRVAELAIRPGVQGIVNVMRA
ncbi:succinylglutamate desuccinylase, partial [Mycobacterium kansasii]